jgi:LysM repeat protein
MPQEDLVKQIRFLTQILIVSGALNVVLFTAFFYFLWARPLTLDKSGQSAYLEINEIKKKNLIEEIEKLESLSLNDLVGYLEDNQLVEDGYRVRDLSLASLVKWHFFDVQRALDGITLQKRKIFYDFKGEKKELVLFPGLEDSHFSQVNQFFNREKWPLTPEGLFLLIKHDSISPEQKSSLEVAFFQTPHFLMMEQLFLRANQGSFSKEFIIQILIEGDWILLEDFFVSEKDIKDFSEKKMQEVLLNYSLRGSKKAAYFLLETDPYFVRKQISDDHVIAFLDLLVEENSIANEYCVDMLTSPRGDLVWEKSANRLYSYQGKIMPTPYEHMDALSLFVSEVDLEEKVQKLEQTITVKQSIVRDKKRIIEGDFEIYIVQAGDSLWSLAQKFNISVETIKTLNEIQGDKILWGKKIFIPLQAPQLEEEQDQILLDAKDGT